ncbi:MAG: hypothetical protein PF795_04665 [Kiritimatiellae bacterium]|jgi:hypothetical protein|nr:hypothetical protein [Kiritimatiellia bacterium]
MKERHFHMYASRYGEYSNPLSEWMEDRSYQEYLDELRIFNRLYAFVMGWDPPRTVLEEPPDPKDTAFDDPERI